MLVPMTCAVCQQPLPEGARFCPNCGAPVATSIGTEERKMVTVLFADLVDSTGLAQRHDPERAREVLGQFYTAASDELRALRGQAEKFIGDAVMAVFGLPQVNEDDAVRAVRAGLAIRERTERLGRSLGLVEPLRVRVGIESGVTATGTGPSGQLLVTGPVVNAAARLQTGAGTGEILVGETTYELTRTSVGFGERREISAKGFARGLAAHPVEGLTARSARRTIPVVGRTIEMTILRESFSRVVATGRPLLFTLLGEPGIGKSRLADEFIAGLEPEVITLTGQSQSYTDSATFAPVGAMLRELIGSDDGDTTDRSLKRLRSLVDRYCEPVEAERITGRLALVLGIGEPRRDESAFVQDVQGGFLSFIECLSGRDRVVLVFEDAHSLRPPMLDLIERLAARSRRGSEAAMVLVVARPDLLDARPSWGSGTVNQTMLRVEPLSRSDAVDLARQSSGGRVDEDTASTIATRTGGNPFFIVEITGMLLRGHDAGSDGGGETLPPTVQAVVAARIDGLPPPLRDVARWVSAFLYSFDADELAFVDRGDIEEELRELEEQEILVRTGGGGSDPRWRFRHETLREVAYGSLPKRERVRLHVAIADGLSGAGHLSWAADHMELAALSSLDLDPDDRAIAERAADALGAAGDRARRRMESRSSLDYYQRALALAADEDTWGVRESRILAGMGEARYWLGEYQAAIDVLDRAVDRANGDTWTLAEALRFRGDIAVNFEGDLDRAEGLLDRSLDAAEELGDPFAISRTLLFAGWVPWTREDFEESERLWKRALVLSEENDDRWARVRALTCLSINRADQKDQVEATRLIEEAQSVANEMGDQFSVAVTSVQRGRLHQDASQPAESVPCFDLAISIFSDLGARWELADATAERGIARRDLGQLDDAEIDLQQAIRISEELGERQLASWTWRALGRVSEKRGNLAEAEERFRRAEEEEARRPR